MGLMLHPRELSGMQDGSSAAVDRVAIPVPRSGQQESLPIVPSRGQPGQGGHAPEGIAYRGLVYGLLIAMPFWIMLVALVVTRR